METVIKPVIYTISDPLTNELFIGSGLNVNQVNGMWCTRKCVNFGRYVSIIEVMPVGTPLAVAESRAEFHARRLNIKKILEPIWTLPLHQSQPHSP